MVGEGDGEHGFSHGDEAGEEAGVVAAFGGDGGRFAGLGDGRLFNRQAAGRFDGGFEEDREAGRDAAKHAAVAVGLGGDAARLRAGNEIIVVRAPLHGDAAEADAVFDAEHGWQTEERFREIGFEFIEHRFSQTRR